MLTTKLNTVDPAQSSIIASAAALGDIFIFPSGTVVSWAVPDDVISGIVSDIISPAAVNPHPKSTEEEDLEYLVDSQREGSSIRGDTILLGTKQKQSSSDQGHSRPMSNSKVDNSNPVDETRSIDTVLAKIAFSSGLARSTKLGTCF